MAKRIFRIGPHIWFVLHTDHTGKITSLQEHDLREGGGIGPRKGMTYEETFVDAAADRAQGDDFKNHVRAAALTFLTSTDQCIDVLATACSSSGDNSP